MRGFIISTLRQARRVIVLVVGCTVLLIGLALLVLPGPAFVVIPVGLAILATEFVWARRLLARVKREAGRAVSAVTGRPQTRSPDKSR
jgi:tellurite resistance protein TerC